MNRETYEVEAAVQQTHWWFVGRRRLLMRLVREMEPRPSWRILEVGTGTGANLPVLASLNVRQVIGCDVSAEALRHAMGTAGLALARADACQLPFRSGAFDLVIAADVIEHLDDDDAALREFARVLAPGGRCLLMVPAFPSLWGPQDIVAHHRRRYRRPHLLALVAGAGLRLVSCFYFNFLLFVPIWMARRALMAARVEIDSENQLNTPWLNRLLTRIFCTDVDHASRLRAPFGVSLCLVGAKRS